MWQKHRKQALYINKIGMKYLTLFGRYLGIPSYIAIKTLAHRKIYESSYAHMFIINLIDIQHSTFKKD